MKKCIIILFAAIFIAGCGSRVEKGPVLARVNNYEITLSEFNDEFRDSKYAAQGTEAAKADFLNDIISRKLMIQDAQAKNLDKDQTFLKMIERVWEQSLLRLVLDDKAKEIAGAVSVTDKAVKDAYDKMVKDGTADKSYESMYGQIKWQLLNLEQEQIMNKWLDDLHKKAHIKIDYDLLKQDNKGGAK